MKKKGMNNNKKPQYFSGGPRGLLVAIIIIVASMVLLKWLTDYTLQVKPISYSSFMKRVESNQVKKILVTDKDVQGLFTDGTKFETVIPETPADWEQFKQHNVEVDIASSSSQMSLWYILPLLSFLITLLAIWYFVRQARGSSGNGGGGGGNIFTMGKSRARMFMPSTIKENFDSVAGAAEAKEELKDVVDFLRNPEKYKRLGAKMTRGVLLVGEPGNGKTLLAKAVAGEANCPFFSISGSDFIEVFVGVGASRVRDLFTQARKHSPSIIFIDEIDAVGRHRGSGLGGGHDEREQTLNQLLTEMDGFQTGDDSVIVIAATNRPDVLDKALLRPGRFDRQVQVPYPDLKSREEILKVHARGVKIDPEVDLSKIARGTPGFSGADLANLINEAAIIASKAGKDLVNIADFEEARDKIMLGKENKTMIRSKEDLEITSYHESGHALIRLLMPKGTDPLHKITIIPRGRALGVTHFLPEKEKQTKNKEEMIASIMAGLGGKAAEELVFNTTTSGAYSDLQGATEIARDMVCYFGMSEKLGPVVYTKRHGSTSYSARTGAIIDQEIQRIMDESYKKALEMLRANRDKLDLLATTLLEKETMFAGEIYQLLGIEPREEHKLI
ncbi:MAG TPA: ATP-dependent zinc metalloprotease FtsH [Candidatus Babeliales bacterium]|nr:ATP-dependent zinc metalloprotease FtsH [Candidatus Babeliales bacterium]